MSRYISDVIRQKVKERANYCCEYCLVQQEDFFLPFEIDYIISARRYPQS